MISTKLVLSSFTAVSVILAPSSKYTAAPTKSVAPISPILTEIVSEQDYANGSKTIKIVKISLDCQTGVRKGPSEASNAVIVDYRKEATSPRARFARAECTAQGSTPGF